VDERLARPVVPAVLGLDEVAPGVGPAGHLDRGVVPAEEAVVPLVGVGLEVAPTRTEEGDHPLGLPGGGELVRGPSPIAQARPPVPPPDPVLVLAVQHGDARVVDLGEEGGERLGVDRVGDADGGVGDLVDPAVEGGERELGPLAAIDALEPMDGRVVEELPRDGVREQPRAGAAVRERIRTSRRDHDDRLARAAARRRELLPRADEDLEPPGHVLEDLGHGVADARALLTAARAGPLGHRDEKVDRATREARREPSPLGPGAIGGLGVVVPRVGRPGARVVVGFLAGRVRHRSVARGTREGAGQGGELLGADALAPPPRAAAEEPLELGPEASVLVDQPRKELDQHVDRGIGRAIAEERAEMGA
jgi:hypothetical protein